MSAELTDEITTINSDTEDIDLGIEEGPHEETSDEGSPGGRYRPPFLILNGMDRDSGFEIPQVQTPLTFRGSDGGRRPSIVLEMINTLAMQGGGEINVDNIPAFDLDMMYASIHQTRRGSLPSNDSHLQDFHTSQSISESLITDNSDHGYTPSCKTCMWQEPTFNSKILETHLKKKVIQFLQRRYRIALIFIGLFSFLWIVFFSVQLPVINNSTQDNELLTSDSLAIRSVQYSSGYIIGGVSLFLLAILFLSATYLQFYSKIAQFLSVMLTMVLMAVSCALAIALHLDNNVVGISTISFVAQFAITATVILVVYTLSRLQLWLSLFLCTSYILILEILAGTLNGVIQSETFSKNSTQPNVVSDYNKFFHAAVVSRMFFYVCLNISGLTTAYLTQSRLHDTYWRIGQCVLAKKQIDSERDIEVKTIHSMMPKFLAKELLDIKAQIVYIIKMEVYSLQDSVPPILRDIAIPFTVRKMSRVSILFADIVGFTKLSSCLTASELVGILNNMFSEFDKLALKTKCETISTLGDCYFCVSGCPKPHSNHADNCVELGLQIIKFLEDYTKHHIRMRVGIHTGSVLCGVMGTQRFRFDVWSHDVTTANRIESVCEPDHVLVSSSTKLYLSIMYTTQEAVNVTKTPELEKYRLFYVKRSREKTNIGHSKLAWRNRIRNIDSLSKGSKEVEEDIKDESDMKLNQLLRRRHSLAINVQEDEIHQSSFRDSLSRQSRLQRCVSYADLANPQVEQQIIIDKKIVGLMDEEDVTFDSYFDSRLHFVWASFGCKELEKRYRKYGRDFIDTQKSITLGTEMGFELTKLSYVVDVASLMMIFILIMIGAAVDFSGFSQSGAFSSGDAPLYQSWLIIFIIGILIESFLLVCVIAVYAPRRFPRKFAYYSFVLINWYWRSFVAIFLIYFPMTMVIISLTQCYGSGFSSIEDLLHVQMSFYITIVVLVSSINFMDVSYIAKVVGGILSATLTVCLVAGIHLESCASKLPGNESRIAEVGNRTVPIDTELEILRNYYNRHVAPEAAILLLLILCLLTVVNRMSEVSVRLSFLGRVKAAEKKQETQQQKNQVEWLLYNIIPPHVALELRKTGKYSCNHECIGVIFASIVNFSEFSSCSEEEESFRLLNRIVREFDMLLNRPDFAYVDKIKTIGSTYMAASGLNFSKKSDPVIHLTQLIDFALQLGKVLSKRSFLVPGFSFLLRVGFNYGPVTSGVVGSRKLMYDIWGDTVNVASRMDTMGMVSKVHMPEQCLVLLKDDIKWQSNKVVNVKGKGDMRTVFITGRQYK